MSIYAYAGHVPPAVAAHGVDKVLHLTMSFVLTIGLGRALRGRVVIAALAVFAMLAIDEYCQRFSPHRSSDWGDLLADALGCLLAMILRARVAGVRGEALPNGCDARTCAPRSDRCCGSRPERSSSHDDCHEGEDFIGVHPRRVE